MVDLLKFFLEKLDVLALAEHLRQRNNRRTAAQLHLIVIHAYEILELYEVILDELKAALDSHKRTGETHRFRLNPSRMASLLHRQASNLEVLERLTYDLLNEVRFLDDKFAKAYLALVPGKTGLLFRAEMLLYEARLPLNEENAEIFPAGTDGIYRTLWFTSDPPSEDRDEVRQYLYGDDGTRKEVIDVNLYDGDEFFKHLHWYFKVNDPYARLKELEAVTDSYKQSLMDNFSIQDILSDIRAIARHDNWAKR